VLSKRLFSALIMVPLVVLSVLYLTPSGFAMLVMLAMLAAAWEWSALVPLYAVPARVTYLLVLVAATAIAWYFARSEVFVNSLLWVTMAWWLFALFWITRPALGSEITSRHTTAKSVLGLALLAGTGGAPQSPRPGAALGVVHPGAGLDR
jgi:phosphatidate cytidylyltransferase